VKIEFLGTSAAWPLPRLNCHCELCSSTDPRDKRKRSSALVNEKLVLDAGFDSYEQLKSRNLVKIAAVAITHEHPDHLAGLWDLGHIYNRKEPLALFVNQKTWNKFRSLFNWKGPLVFAEPFQEYKLENLTLTFLPVTHTDSSFGILVKEGKASFFYAPDMGGLPAETSQVLTGIDLIAFDGSSADKKGQTKGHQSMIQGTKLAKELGVKQAFFTHIGHLTLPHKKQNELFVELGAYDVQLAHDGLKLEIPSSK
jgi:phosphoribosyl 1,2-cyclic phosphate phosphodiesterase